MTSLRRLSSASFWKKRPADCAPARRRIAPGGLPAKARQRDKHLADATEDWSSEDVDAALTAHVEGRVAEYLDPGIIASIRAEWLGPDRLSF